jgi:membrane protease YdiL (CAAX protease family)
VTSLRRRSSDTPSSSTGLSEEQAARAFVERTVLDEQAAASRANDQQPWGVRTWLGPVLTLVALIVGGNVLVGAVLPRNGPGRTAGGIAIAIGVELLLIAALLAFGRPAAARAGGWRAAFGLDRVRATDWRAWAVGFGFVWLGRSAVDLVANLLTAGRATAEASNVHLHHPAAASIATLAVTSILLAPVAEELMFRGLLLRTFMRRLSFWPAALLSTALFALFHVYEVGTVVGAVTLACSVAVLGLCNSYLVRITGRLTPGIMVHATYNALAFTVAVLHAVH